MRKTTGISLMLLIFLSLCLMIFSLLSLSGAAADEKLSRKAANRTTEYYAAVSTANKMLAEIDELLASCLKESEAADRPRDAWKELCGQLPTILADAQTAADTQYLELYWNPAEENDTDKNNTAENDIPETHTGSAPNSNSSDGTVSGERSTIGTLSFDVIVNEGQVLHAELSLHYPEADDDTMYDIIQWKIVNTQEWTADRSQNLFRTDTVLP